VIDISAFISNETEGKKTLSTAGQIQHFWKFSGDFCCFAGANDTIRKRHQIIRLCMYHLTTTTFSNTIGLFYSKEWSSLVSCDQDFDEGVIKVWTTFKLPQPPTENELLVM